MTARVWHHRCLCEIGSKLIPTREIWLNQLEDRHPVARSIGVTMRQLYGYRWGCSQRWMVQQQKQDGEQCASCANIGLKNPPTYIVAERCVCLCVCGSHYIPSTNSDS